MGRWLPLLAGSAIVCFLAAGTSAKAQRQPDPGRPTIRIASPFAGPVWRVDIDAGEGFAVASHAGKAVTIWPLADARLATSARVPLLHHENKRAHAVAISPNAEFVAYSVPSLLDASGTRNAAGSSRIFILRRASGRIVTVLDGRAGDIATRPQSLKFSPDGAHLAAVLSSGCGVRVWTTRNWQLAFKDDVGYAGEAGADRCCRSNDARCEALPDTTGVTFLAPRNGQPYLVTSGDSGVRVYDKAEETVALRAHARPQDVDLERPSGIATSPDGRQLLVGDRRDRRNAPPLRLRMAVLDAVSLAPLRRPLEIREDMLRSAAYLQGGPEVRDMAQASLDRVAWMRDANGEYLIGAGAFPCETVRPAFLVTVSGQPSGSGAMCLVRWPAAAAAQGASVEPRFIPVGSERVIDVAAMPRRGGLLILSQRRVAAVDAGGRPLQDAGRALLDQANQALDLRDSDRRFRISADGRSIEAEDYASAPGGTRLVTFDLAGPTAVAASSGTATIDPDQGRNLIEGWRNVQGRSPRILGRQLAADEVRPYEVLRAVAVRREAKQLVLASSEHIRVVDFGEGMPRVLCREPVTEEAYRINVTADGRLVISGHADGTLRWWRMEDGLSGCRLELLLTVHLSEAAPGKWTWAAWRPSGHYARDMDSDLKLEWQRTLQDGQVGLTELHRLLLHIDRDAIRHAADPPVRPPGSSEAALPAGPDEDLLRLEQKPVPLIELTNSAQERNFSREQATLRLVVGDGERRTRRLAVKLRDETPLAMVYAGRAVPAGESVELDEGQSGIPRAVTLDVVLPAKARLQTGADIQLCFHVDGAPEPDSCHPTKWVGLPAPPPPRRLWALIIGVSRASRGSGLDLRFPENDAIDIASLFIGDFERRVTRRASPLPPDYSRLSIDLAVSAFAGAEAELTPLAAHAYVRRRTADKAQIAAALMKVAQDIADLNRSEPGDDLFLMTYSGHGIVDPNRRGGTVLLTADATQPIRNERDLKVMAANGLSSRELLHLLRQIPARKLIIVDACRSLARLAIAQPFSPELMRTEFEGQSLDTHFLFSSDVGQEAFELPAAAYNRQRPGDRQGNGIFTFALLNALSKPRTDTRAAEQARRIDIPWIASFLTNTFFNRGDPGSPANLLRSRHPGELPYVPTPKYIPARSDRSDQLLRTLE